MKIFGLTGLKRFLVTALLGLGLVLLLVPGAISAPVSSPQTLIAQTSEVKSAPSPQPASPIAPMPSVEEPAQPKPATTEQRSTQNEQPPSRETAARGKNQGDRASTQAPYDPYDIDAIRQFDNSWYGQ